MCYERRFFVSSAKKKGFEAREVHTRDSACSPARATGSSDTELELATELVLLPVDPQRQCSMLESIVIHGSLRHIPQRSRSASTVVTGASHVRFLQT